MEIVPYNKKEWELIQEYHILYTIHNCPNLTANIKRMAIKYIIDEVLPDRNDDYWKTVELSGMFMWGNTSLGKKWWKNVSDKLKL